MQKMVDLVWMMCYSLSMRTEEYEIRLAQRKAKQEEANASAREAAAKRGIQIGAEAFLVHGKPVDVRRKRIYRVTVENVYASAFGGGAMVDGRSGKRRITVLLRHAFHSRMRAKEYASHLGD